MKRILIFISFILIYVNGFSQNTIEKSTAIIHDWIIYQGDTLTNVTFSGDTIFGTKGSVKDTLLLGGASIFYLENDTAKTDYNVVVDSSFLMDYGGWYMGYQNNGIINDPLDANYDSLVMMGYTNYNATKAAMIYAGSDASTEYSVRSEVRDATATSSVLQTGNKLEINANEVLIDTLKTADKTYWIAHWNQSTKQLEKIGLNSLGDTIAAAGGGAWTEDADSIYPSTEYKTIQLNWPDSIMYTANNTGADYDFTHTYEAFKFVADKDYPAGTLGPIDLFLKKTGTITNVTGALQKYIYSDNAGVPGTALSSITEPEMYGHISTSYTAYPSQNGSPALTSGTAYWLVVQRTAAPAGGNVYVQCAASGTAMVAYSSDGSSWTPVNSYTAKYVIHWEGHEAIRIDNQHNIGIYSLSETEYGFSGYSVYDAGVRGVSVNAEGVQGNSTYGNGLQGNSTHNIGTVGVSTNNAGVYGVSTNSYGTYGVTLKTGFAGIYGQGVVSGARGGYFESTDSYGLVSVSTGGNGIYAYSANSTPGYFLANPSTTNATTTVLRLEANSTGTPAAGIGSSVDFYAENSTGGGGATSAIAGYSQKVTASSERGALVFRTLGVDGLGNRMFLDSNGTVLVNPYKNYGITANANQSGFAGIHGVGNVSGARGGYFESTDSYGLVSGSTSGNGVYTYSSSSTPAYLLKYGNAANAEGEILRIEVGTAGTAAAGIGSNIGFYHENSAGSGIRMAGISATSQSATSTKEGGSLTFSTYKTIGGYAARMVIDSAGNGSITGQWTTGNSFGELFEDATNTTAVIATYRTITSWQAGQYNATTLGDSTITVAQAGTYLINYSASFTHSVNNTLCHISLFVNGTEDTSLEAERKIGTAGDLGSMSGTAIVTLTANAVLKLRALATNNGDLTINHANFNVSRIR